MSAEQKKPIGFLRSAYTALGILALILGVTSTGWLILMAKQWALPWSTLAITAPPAASSGPPPAGEPQSEDSAPD